MLNTQPTLFDHSYHNTVPLNGVELDDRKEKTANQDKMILEFFEVYHALDFTACEIFTSLKHKENILLTSVRRAITNLTIDGKLIKTENKRRGIYKHLVSTWRLKLENELIRLNKTGV